MILHNALRDLLAAKDLEAAATKKRLAAEAAVLALAGPLPDEGTARRDAGDYVAVIRCSMTRKVDADALLALADEIPEPIAKRLFKWSPTVDLKELRYVQSNEPELYAVVSQAITSKPGKPSVSVELAAQQEAA